MKKTLLISAIFVLISAGAVYPTTYYLTVDVPSNLGGTDYGVNEIVKSVDSSYSLENSLASDTEVSALCQKDQNTWLFSPAFPKNLGGTEYEARDVVTFDGSNYSSYLDGSSAGIPSYAKIDTLFLDSNGDIILGFDVPVNLGGTQYSQNDLVKYNSGFSLYWDGDSPGIPPGTNVVGADEDDSTGNIVLSFDVPTGLGGTDYLPGELVQWDGSSFSSFYRDSGWSLSSVLGGFSFQAAVPAGYVPDGDTVSGTPLLAEKSGSDIALDWDASCISEDQDYAIYEGTLGSFYSHGSKVCTTGGSTNDTVTPSSGATYYLIVPLSTNREGSYGVDSNNTERPQGGSACEIQDYQACP